MTPDAEATVADREAALARLARRLGLAGVIPFAALALWLYGIADTHPWRDGTIVLLRGYAVIILSFLGGVRWGLAIAGGGRQRRDLALGVVPALAGWATFALPAAPAFAVLAVCFAGHGAWDSFAVAEGAAPEWYGRLRLWLTVLVVAALLLAALAAA
ncbi:DUF3429 domain-containing protein [Aquibium sp. A9E412]|uniref:DUF3429 domain-containing protein n=1 Tax=Aquibium sp. A9E412 TaxID=2976767 RepID=UPI0025B00AA6|nr:DUF3429 domain-containing protein [Aquibium sp. A9E412]MDN2567782.1 DUF3429 domain-containing protein [Aquibium sp. A9E412]